MIIIAGVVEVDPEQREAALEAARPLLEPTREQSGCLDYVWSADPAVPGRIYVFERWEDRDSLAAHFAGPWYPAMLKAISSHGLKSADVYKYRPEVQEPVYGKDGKPKADFLADA